VEGLPLLLNWYVVHRRTKRLPPVAQAFKDFLLDEGAGLIARAVPWHSPAEPPRSASEGREHGAPVIALAHQLAHGAVEDDDGHRGHELAPGLGSVTGGIVGLGTQDR